MSGESVVVVDDDPSSANYMTLALQQAGYAARVARSGTEALLAIDGRLPSLVIADMHMPGMDGLELLARVKDRWPNLPVVMVTVEEQVSTIIRAIQGGAINYLVKPVSPSVLQVAAAQAIARAAARGPPSRADVVGREIVGAGPAIGRVRELVELASRSDVNVVITGETGTGKELVARAIHKSSGAPSRPFVAHNCALTPPDLFDSEFFGHRRGAFTGADRDRPGLLKEAHGGILFLDELECLSLSHQAKLLRVLDDGEIRPVGSEKLSAVSVRYLAATNRLPESMLESGQLREDFYSRLRGFEIRLPPLRERPEDVAELAEHFLGKAGRLTPQALQSLRSHDWPGNVRQLRNVLRSALPRSSAGVIDDSHMDLEWRGRGPSGPPPFAASTHESAGEVQPKLSLEAIERQAIVDALSAHQGNRGRAAEALGIHRSTLRRKMREFGIDG